MKKIVLSGACLLFCLTSCENLMNEVPSGLTPETEMRSTPITLSETARLLSQLPIGAEQMKEVHDAVDASLDNGFDEEYMLSDLFESPGSGVGDRMLAEETKARAGGNTKSDTEKRYASPLRDLIRGALRKEQETKSRGVDEASPEGEETIDAVEERIRLLCDSGVQIYWPYSENWDGESLPIVTFDPGDGFDRNIGWQLAPDGSLAEEVTVDETTARSGCVWVVNSNEDCELLPLSFIRKTDPTWGLPDHGTIVVGGTKAAAKSKTLLLKKFTAKRQFDNWFSGGSEFFIKIGKVEDFKATTEAEMLLYKPSITDFMVAVKRKDIGKELDFNALLVSEWTDQLSMCAFLITEDDGGTITKWDCNAVVKINSKSFGFEISIPVNSKDDIVWRGQLSGKYINATANLTGHFGDVDLVFEVVEY